MPIVVPGKRPAPRLQRSKVFGQKAFGKKHSGYANLNLTPMVDMFTIIVIYLLQNFSSDESVLLSTPDITMPSITSKAKIERGPVVAVSATNIVLNGAFVKGDVAQTADVKEGATLDFQALTDKLAEEKQKILDAQSLTGGDGFRGIVNLQVDKNVEFAVLKKVIHGCSVAGFTNVNFAGMQTSAPSDAAAVAP